MLTQSEKDSREKKELKALVVTVAAYIASLMNLEALPVVQTPQSFDPNFADSQQLVKQMQKGKLLSDAMQDWVNSIIKEGNKFILDFTTVYVEGETLLGEIQTLTPRWKTKQSQCQAIVFQVTEVEKYGVLKFLGKKSMKIVDYCMLFIMKHNIIWKESIYKEVVKEMQAIEKKIVGMHEELLKDINIVNPTGILQFDDRNMHSEALTKSFNGAVTKIKDNEMPTAGDFTTLVNIESMLYLNRNLMPR